MAIEYKGIKDFCFKATMLAIERLNAGEGDAELILELIDRVINMYNTGMITKAQLNVIEAALEIDIPVPEEPESQDEDVDPEI